MSKPKISVFRKTVEIILNKKCRIYKKILLKFYSFILLKECVKKLRILLYFKTR